MKIIIHDLNQKLDISGSIEFNGQNIKSCIGCFSCWFKTPKNCIHNDDLKTIGNLLLNCDEVIIISKCINGCYSSTVKQILERCISYVEPFFEIRNGEIHHKLRIDKKLKFYILFYGNITLNDKICAKYLVDANIKNFNATLESLNFLEDDVKIKEWLNDKYC